MPPTVTPLSPPPGSDINFGAIIDHVDVENLTGTLPPSLDLTIEQTTR